MDRSLTPLPHAIPLDAACQADKTGSRTDIYEPPQHAPLLLSPAQLARQLARPRRPRQASCWADRRAACGACRAHHGERRQKGEVLGVRAGGPCIVLQRQADWPSRNSAYLHAQPDLTTCGTTHNPWTARTRPPRLATACASCGCPSRVSQVSMATTGTRTDWTRQYDTQM